MESCASTLCKSGHSSRALLNKGVKRFSALHYDVFVARIAMKSEFL